MFIHAMGSVEDQLARVSAEAGEFEAAAQHCEESLRWLRMQFGLPDETRNGAASASASASTSASASASESMPPLELGMEYYKLAQLYFNCGPLSPHKGRALEVIDKAAAVLAPLHSKESEILQELSQMRMLLTGMF